jgi:hypothetical protein
MIASDGAAEFIAHREPTHSVEAHATLRNSLPNICPPGESNLLSLQSPIFDMQFRAELKPTRKCWFIMNHCLGTEYEKIGKSFEEWNSSGPLMSVSAAVCRA